jgi:methyl-accepting chemotaxis protein
VSHVQFTFEESSLSRRLPLSLKLAGSFAVVLVLTVVLGLMAIARLGSVKHEGASLYQHAYVPTVSAVYAGTLSKDLALQSATYNGILAAHGGDAVAAQKDPRLKPVLPAISKDEKAFKTVAAGLADAPADLKPLAAKLINASSDYKTTLATLLKIKPTDPRTVTIGARLAKDIATIDSTSQEFSRRSDGEAKAANGKIANAYSSGKGIILLVLLLAVLLGGALAFVLSRSISRGVRDVLDRLTKLRDNCITGLRGGIEAVAHGDLAVEVIPTTTPIERISNDEIGDVATAVNAIRDNAVATIEAYNDTRASLNSMIGEVSSTAGTLSAASQQMASTSEEAGRAVSEIAGAVTEVAAGAERQVRTVESAKSLVEGVATATTQSSGSAQETAAAAEQARRVAEEGAQAVRGATDAMTAVREASEQATGAIRELGAKSEQIGGIVDTITGIAAQTNLLALNAAIEAARAGEQGRGFAVVAEEVRKLAEESQAAAASIAALIREIQDETTRAVEVVESGGKRTEEGAATVEQAREAFERIAGAIEDVSTRVSEIAVVVEQIASSSARVQADIGEVAAVAEQTSASSQQVSATTEQTSASAQQIAASAQELSRTAETLAQLVGRFQLAA